MRKHDSFEDDGRTIADMSGIGPTPTLLPHSRKPAAAPEPVNDRPWEQPDEWTAKPTWWVWRCCWPCCSGCGNDLIKARI